MAVVKLVKALVKAWKHYILLMYKKGNEAEGEKGGEMVGGQISTCS